MKILHIHITGPYNEDGTYQENLLPEAQAKQGHSVVLWASVYAWDGVRIKRLPEIRKEMPNGVILQRLEYKRIICDFITKKVRSISCIYSRLCDENPDFIMMHGCQTAIVPDVVKYIQENKNVRFVIDSHTDRFNSAKGFLSYCILHKMFYANFMRKAYFSCTRAYYISAEAKETLIKLYGLPDDKMFFLPLGGFIPNDEEYAMNRRTLRAELGIDDEVINILHSGKLYPEKRTKDLIKAFEGLKDVNVHLTIIGSAEGGVLESILKAEKADNRISWLGWKNGDELSDYLCTGDLYVLPGDLSATVQSAMCHRNAVVVYPYDNYRIMNLNELCYSETQDALRSNIQKIVENKILLEQLRNEAYTYACEWFDYNQQAIKILE